MASTDIRPQRPPSAPIPVSGFRGPTFDPQEAFGHVSAKVGNATGSGHLREIAGLQQPAISGLSRSPRKFPMSGRSREQAEVAPAVDAWRRYQRGEARKYACEDAYYAFSGPADPSRTAGWIDSSRRFQYAAHLWLG